MSSSRYSEIARIFREAVELPTAERFDFLDAACGEDAELRREVESLLGFDESPHGILEEGEAIAAAMGGDALDLHGSERGALPSQIGRYRVIELFGEGGMGSVFLAEQDMPRRTVALKVIRAGLVVPSALRRFERETRALAKLQHPGIAQIYDAGTAKTDRGACPFIAMEVVRGQTLLAFAESARLNVRARVRLVVDVCLAVQHAHDQGIIHRDIKPSNVLVTAEGRVKLLDFGIARLDDDAAKVTLETRPGQIIGTLPYMSPEQFAHPPMSDARSDIYALGVLLFETLTGQTPHDLGSRPIADAVREKMEREPRRLRSIDRALRGDLDTIVSVCLAREPGRRYASALDLARDLERHLEDQPIAARPASAWYQLAKYARRNRSVVLLTSLVLLTLIVATVTSVIWSVQAEEARVAADAAQAESRRQAQVAERRAYVANIAAAGAAIEAGNVSAAMQRLANVDPSMRDTWEYRHFETRLNEALVTFNDPDAPFIAVAPTGRGDQLLASTWRWRLLHLDGRPLKEVRPFEVLGNQGASIAVEARRGWAFIACFNGVLQMVRLDGGRGAAKQLAKEPLRLVRLSDDGTRMLVSVRSPPTVEIHSVQWPPEGSEEAPSIELLRSFEGRAGAISGDGEKIAVANGPRIEVRAVRDGSLLTRSGEQGGPTWMVAFSPNGNQLLSGSEDRCARVWVMPTTLGTGTEMTLGWMQRFRAPVGNVAWAPDGDRFACLLWDGALHVHELSTGSDLQFLGNLSHGEDLAWMPDGSTLVTCGQDHTVRLWPSRKRPYNSSLPRQLTNIMAVALSGDGRYAYSATRDGAFRRFDVEAQTEHSVLTPDPPVLGPFVLSPDSLLAYVGLSGATLGVIDVESNTLKQTLDLSAKRIDSLAISPSGAEILAGLDDGRIEVVDAARLTRIATAIKGSSPVRSVAIAASRRLALGGFGDGEVMVAPLDGSTPPRLLYKFSGTATGVRFSQDESLAYGASTDTTLRAWSLVEDPTQEAEPFGSEVFRAGATSPILSLAVTPDGTRLMGGLSGGGMVVWDATNGDPMLLVNVSERTVDSINFDRLGTSLIFASSTGNISVIRQRKLPVAAGDAEHGAATPTKGP